MAASGMALMERVVVQGDLAALNDGDRVKYYAAVCESVGLNPLTRPLEYIRLNNKLVLYAKRDATDQLRSLRGVSVEKLEREVSEDCYVVTAYGRTGDGRTDSAIGAVSIAGLKGEARANAMMKAETKAKRRLTLSLCGLGMLDETEVSDIPDARQAEMRDVTPRPDPASPPAAADPRFANGNVSEAQIKRLFALAAERGKAIEVDRTDIVRDVLKRRGIEHTREIPRAAYETICAEVEKWEIPTSETPDAAEEAF